MLEVVKAPHEPTLPANDLRDAVFLAGSIEMGVAERWQDRVVRELQGHHLIVLNPRRDDWDSAWVQSIHNPQFREQVEWKLRWLEQVEFVLMHFDPDTRSPITLLELGLLAGLWDQGAGVVVSCPPGFWRRGNVEIVCNRYRMTLTENLSSAIQWLKERIA